MELFLYWKNYSYNDNSLQEVTSRKVYLKQGGSTEEMVTFPSVKFHWSSSLWTMKHGLKRVR